MKIRYNPVGLFYLLDEEGIGKPLGRINAQTFKKIRPALTEECWDGGTTKYVKRDIDLFINMCLRNEDWDVLELILKNRVLPPDQVDKAVEKAIKGKKYEAQVMLMRYKDELGGFSEATDSITDRFSL